MADVALPPCSVAAAAEVTTGEQWRQQHPTWLLTSLRAGTITDRTGRGDDTSYPVEVHGLGMLPLPDGRVVGCDPYLADLDTPAYDLALPPGDHPVGVAVVRIAGDHVRPTALFVVVGTAPIVRWTLARTTPADGGTGDDVDDLRVGEILGYGVDAGTGALLSPLALPALVEVGRADGGMLEDPLSVAMAASPLDAASVPPRPGALPVAQCTSGWGDGAYATWVGWDADGAVSLVMTDFSVAGDPWSDDDEPVAATAPAAAPPTATTPQPRRGFWSRLLGGGGR